MKISKAALLTLSGIFSIAGLGLMLVSAIDLKLDPSNAVQHMGMVKIISDSTNTTATLREKDDGLVWIETEYNFILSKTGTEENNVFGVKASSILGGRNNVISGTIDLPNGNVILGGSGNYINGTYNVILGGELNRILGQKGNSTILGGRNNIVEGSNSAIVGGSGNTVKGNQSVVAGSNSTVSGSNSAALGMNTHVYANNSFLWTDGTRENDALTVSNVFAVVGGSGMVIGTNQAHKFAQLTLKGSLVMSAAENDLSCSSTNSGTLKVVNMEGNDKICLCSCDGSGWTSMFGLGPCLNACTNGTYNTPVCGDTVTKICSGGMSMYSGECEIGKPLDGTGAYLVTKDNKVHWSCQTDDGTVDRSCSAEVSNGAGYTCGGCIDPEPGENTDKGSETPGYNKSWEYQEDPNVSLGACEWRCKENYERSGNRCEPNTKNGTCTGLPANGEWQNSTFKQTWNGSAWTPASKTASASTYNKGTSVECSWKCMTNYSPNANYTACEFIDQRACVNYKEYKECSDGITGTPTTDTEDKRYWKCGNNTCVTCNSANGYVVDNGSCVKSENIDGACNFDTAGCLAGDYSFIGQDSVGKAWFCNGKGTGRDRRCSLKWNCGGSCSVDPARDDECAELYNNQGYGVEGFGESDCKNAGYMGVGSDRQPCYRATPLSTIPYHKLNLCSGPDAGSCSIWTADLMCNTEERWVAGDANTTMSYHGTDANTKCNAIITKKPSCDSSISWGFGTTTLTYRSNGCGIAPDSVTMTYSPAIYAATGMKSINDGWTLDRWCDQPNGGNGSTCYYKGQIIKQANRTPPKSITLYAQCTEEPECVNYKEYKECSDGITGTPITDTEDKRYWKCGNNTCVTCNSANGYMVDNGACVKENKNYTIKFHPEGGEGTMSDQIVECGKSFTINKNKFTKNGYKFNDWIFHADCDNICSISDEEYFGITADNYEDFVHDHQCGSTINLYADWTLNNYNVCTPSITHNTSAGTITANDCESTITIKDKNVGASAAGMGSSSYGKYFRRGNNVGFTLSELSSVNFGFSITERYVKYFDIDRRDLGGTITGPCGAGYHVPSKDERDKLYKIHYNIRNYGNINIGSFEEEFLLPNNGYVTKGSRNSIEDGGNFYLYSSSYRTNIGGGYIEDLEDPTTVFKGSLTPYFASYSVGNGYDEVTSTFGSMNDAGVLMPIRCFKN